MTEFDYVLLGSSKDVSEYTENTKKILSFAIPSPKVFDESKKIEAGTLRLPKNMKSGNAMLCSETTTHACHAGTWIHTKKQCEYNEIGDIDHKKLKNIWKISKELGWNLV